VTGQGGDADADGQGRADESPVRARQATATVSH
jgi:hypothetical protein